MCWILAETPKQIVWTCFGKTGGPDKARTCDLHDVNVTL